MTTQSTAEIAINAALTHSDENGCYSFMLPVPKTAPQLFLIFGDGGSCVSLLKCQGFIAESKPANIGRMTTPTQMPESLKVPTLPGSLLNTIGEYGMARTDRVSELTILHRWELLIAGIKEYTADVLRSSLADAQSALKDRDAEIERLKKDAERWDFVRHHWSNVQMRWNNDETNSLKSITLTVKTAHWSCDADAIESQIDAAIDSMKGDANG